MIMYFLFRSWKKEKKCPSPPIYVFSEVFQPLPTIPPPLLQKSKKMPPSPEQLGREEWGRPIFPTSHRFDMPIFRQISKFVGKTGCRSSGTSAISTNLSVEILGHPIVTTYCSDIPLFWYHNLHFDLIIFCLLGLFFW